MAFVPSPATPAPYHPPNSNIYASGSSSGATFNTPASQAMTSALQDKNGLMSRKRILNGGGSEHSEGAAYRPVAYRTEGLFKFSGIFTSTFVCGMCSVFVSAGWDSETEG